MSRAEDVRFGSWKEIAGYLGRDIRTVRRWEKTRGLPVHRVPGSGRRVVYAFKNEIDSWLFESAPLNGDESKPLSEATLFAPRPASIQPALRTSRWRAIARQPRWLRTGAAIVALAAIAASVFAYRIKRSQETPVVISLGPSNNPSNLGHSPSFAVSRSQASIADALVRKGEISIKTNPGKMYLYGLVTDGSGPTTPFAAGQYAKAIDSAGQLGAALAFGGFDNDRFSTQTYAHVIGGISVAGSWDTFDAFSGSNQQPGAPFASVNFTVPTDSLVVIIGLASGQQFLNIGGITEFLTDAWSSGAGTEAMIIGHVYLKAGTYTVVENSSSATGQAPEHMVDLIGVFVFGSKSDRAPGEKMQKSQPQRSERITSANQCLDATLSNLGVRPVGTVQIASGDGAFSGVTSANKLVSVRKGESLAGSVILRTLNVAPSFAKTPLIETPSWGDHRTSWTPVADLHPGQSTVAARINTRVPSEPGTYHILFAFNMEMAGGDVASATNWARGQDLWYDGNDIAQFDAGQISDAQRFGCVVGTALGVNGYSLMFVPSDAITVEVKP